ncbi:MAG: hypothetical protein KY429_11105, partial [Actinobacteria bacterium]|nr:hypothetical protein [Actinomycetota bacterium]
MTLRSAVITYDGLPISSGGAHSLGKRPPGEVWPDLLTFLSTCTDFKLPDQVNFLYYESRQSPRDYARRVRDALNPVYGRRARRVMGSDAGWKEWE